MNVTIYSTTTCGFCKMLKKYLDDKGIAYEEKVADMDEKLAHELFEKSHGYAVPFTIVTKDDGTTAEILGFDRKQIDAAVGISA